MAFPEGIYYNRKKDECRTPKVNEAFRYIARLAGFSGEKERRDMQFELHAPASVGPTGEMSNQIWADLIEIYNVAKKLNL